MKKAMAAHSSTLAWEIPWTQDPGGLQSTGSQRVGHNRVTSLSLSSKEHVSFMLWQQSPSTVIFGAQEIRILKEFCRNYQCEIDIINFIFIHSVFPKWACVNL